MKLAVEAHVAERGLDVAFDVEAGETLALLGPNGAGKSSVLDVIAGLLAPDEGTVNLGGRVLTDVRVGSPTRQVAPHARGIALLSQDPMLFPHLTVLDNVAFGPRSTGAGRNESREQATAWLAEIGLADLSDRRPAQLSGGQAQRVAVARAIAGNPALLLLDEPMAALDVAVAPELRFTLRRVMAERTAIIVTHDILDALLLADRVMIIESGKITEEGPGLQVLTTPKSAFAAQLAGLNMITGTWTPDGLATTRFGTIHGTPLDPAPVPHQAAAAVFPPTAVAVYLRPPDGSPRNVIHTTIDDLEPHAGHIRVIAGGLIADVTVQAAAELSLMPGLEVALVVKSVEVSVYGL